MIKGIGIDLLEIKRMEKALKNHSPSFKRKIFTTREWEDGLKRSRFSFWAGRFAAKEAVIKALGGNWQFCRWQEIEIISDGKPYLKIYGKTQELAKEKGIECWHLSLSHTKDFVVAIVVAEGNL